MTYNGMGAGLVTEFISFASNHNKSQLLKFSSSTSFSLELALAFELEFL
jgi:hypothetical protein